MRTLALSATTLVAIAGLVVAGPAQSEIMSGDHRSQTYCEETANAFSFYAEYSWEEIGELIESAQEQVTTFPQLDEVGQRIAIANLDHAYTAALVRACEDYKGDK